MGIGIVQEGWSEWRAHELYRSELDSGPTLNTLEARSLIRKLRGSVKAEIESPAVGGDVVILGIFENRGGVFGAICFERTSFTMPQELPWSATRADRAPASA